MNETDRSERAVLARLIEGRKLLEDFLEHEHSPEQSRFLRGQIDEIKQAEANIRRNLLRLV